MLDSSIKPLADTEYFKPGLASGLAVIIFTVAPRPPEGTSTLDDLYTSSALTPSEDRFSRLNERELPVPGICLPLSVSKLNEGPKPRTVIWLPSLLLRLIVTPVILCKDSARLVSGNLPISSADIASTIPEAALFISCDRAKLPLMPLTSIISTVSSKFAP